MARIGVADLRGAAVGPSMAAGAMGKTEQKRSEETEGSSPEEGQVDRAFDLWLRRGLHQLYDTVAKEPIPEDLLRLIEEDRGTRKP